MTIFFLSMAVTTYVGSFFCMLSGLTCIPYKKDLYIKTLGVYNLITIILFIMCVWIGGLNV